jgi:hypothetical protein
MDNIDLLEKLAAGISINSDPMLLHALKGRIIAPKY